MSSSASFPLLAIALGAMGLVVVLNLIADWPAHSARRLQVAEALRSE
jgi:hypothetical protein